MIKRQPKFTQNVEIGLRLRSERQKIGLSQSDFAALVAGSLQTQMRYETGQALPKLDYLFALSKHGVDAGYVVTGVRTEGVLLQTDQEYDLIGHFRNLKDEDRDTVFALVNHFAARDADQAWAVDTRPEAKSGATLHAPKASFRGETDE